MKKLSLILISMMLILSVVGVVSATNGILDEETVTMGYQDVRTVQYCLFEQGVPQDVTVVVDPICRDLNTLIGCNSGDEYNPDGFSVVPSEPTTGPDGCVDIVITTDLEQGEEGLFYYTVNGQVGDSYVGAETGNVFVPEFTVLASLGVLGLAGLYIAKKRR